MKRLRTILSWVMGPFLIVAMLVGYFLASLGILIVFIFLQLSGGDR